MELLIQHSEGQHNGKNHFQTVSSATRHKLMVMDMFDPEGNASSLTHSILFNFNGGTRGGSQNTGKMAYI
jgi:hypothetical protein